MGYATFAVLFSVLDVGFLLVRVAGLVALSRSPALAMTLVVVSISPSVIFPVLTYPARLFKRKKRESVREVDVEADIVVTATERKEYPTSVYGLFHPDHTRLSVVPEIVALNVM